MRARFARQAALGGMVITTALGAFGLTASCGNQNQGFSGPGPAQSSQNPGNPGFGEQLAPCDGRTGTISGTVYDPAGKTPLYNVIVSTPTTQPDPIPQGLTCDRCGSNVTGNPSSTALTDARGAFTLKDVPAGENVRLVMQIGKWRRTVVLPKVEACRDNVIQDRNLTRLPRNQSEGDLPQIALATGACDVLECLLRKVGIDDAEFTAESGPGKVHVYEGENGGDVAGSTSASRDLWPNLDKLKKYDIVINSCECHANSRGNSYGPMRDYLNAGGRMFATHYHYNWFAPPSGPSDFRAVADWRVEESIFKDNSDWPAPRPPFHINTGFPKGQAFSDWIQFIYKSNPPVPGDINLLYAEKDVAGVAPGTTNWIYTGDLGGVYSSKYLTFNTPLQAPDDQRCGRAVFSDLHVASTPPDAGAQEKSQRFPTGCQDRDMTQQERALEFLFFDLSSCIQKDTEPPKPPPR